MTSDINVKDKTITVLEETVGEHLSDLAVVLYLWLCYSNFRSPKLTLVSFFFFHLRVIPSLQSRT